MKRRAPRPDRLANRVRTRPVRSSLIALLTALLVGLTVSARAMPIDGGSSTSSIRYWLTILHNNDAESQLLNSGPGLEDFGGAAAFKAVVERLRGEATTVVNRSSGAGRGVVMISAGDNFLAGPTFAVSQANGVPFYDTVAMEHIGYDAVGFGNHDFDFGPDVLAEFLSGYTEPPFYVAANLNFSGEPALQTFVDEGIIRNNVIIRERGTRIGVIGLQTPNLPFSSSPGNVVVGQDLVRPVLNAAGRMQQRGVNIVILVSHLQDIRNEIALVELLSGVDVVIAGGGHELLANPGDVLIPGDTADLPYPVWATDSTGRRIPIVTTSGGYRYVGKLVAGFDVNGDLVFLDRNRSGPVRVATGDCNGQNPCDDTVTPDPGVTANVTRPVREGLTALAADIIGETDVVLDGTRDTVRSEESNLGNLMADAMLWQAQQLLEAGEIAPVEAPLVALQNGGGMGSDTRFAAGEISTLDTFDMAPFPDFIVRVEPITRAQFKEILENGVACTQRRDSANEHCSTGRFLQVAGFRFQWSAAGDGLMLDLDGNVVQEGTRVQSVVLDGGEVIVEDGQVVAGGPIAVVTLDFTARGGDQAPFREATAEILGVTYQQAVRDYIVEGLDGEITMADYPAGGDGRIVPLR